MGKITSGYKAFNTEIPEQLFKDFAKKCIEDGVSKKDYLRMILEKELYGTQEKK